MPCRDYDDTPSMTVSGQLVQRDARIKKLQDRNDMLARIACNVMRTLIHRMPVFTMVTDKAILTELKSAGVNPAQRNEVVEWWNLHKEADAKAQAQAALVAEGHATVKKLTKKQREALRAIGVNIKEPVKE
jgi:predicted DNA-binding protein (MmcQ/YjbR family)